MWSRAVTGYQETIRSMSNRNKAMSVACLSMLLIGGDAVIIPNAVQDPSKSLLSSSAAVSAATETEKSESKGGDNPKPETPVTSKYSVFKTMEEVSRNRPIEPKIGVKNPDLKPKISFNEAKTTHITFATPDIKSIGAPRNFSATAYSLRGITASGVYVRRGVIAADPRVLPLGSVVQVTAGNWSGTYSVQDTGRLIKGNIIDVWVPSTKEAMNFGRRRVTIKVLKYGKRKR